MVSIRASHPAAPGLNLGFPRIFPPKILDVAEFIDRSTLLGVRGLWNWLKS